MRDSDVRPVQLHDGQCVVVDEAPAPVRCPLSRSSMARSARTWRCLCQHVCQHVCQQV